MSAYDALPAPLRAKLDAARTQGLLTPYELESTALGLHRPGDTAYVQIGHDPGCPAIAARDLACCSCSDPWIAAAFHDGRPAWIEMSGGWRPQSEAVADPRTVARMIGQLIREGML